MSILDEAINEFIRVFSGKELNEFIKLSLAEEDRMVEIYYSLIDMLDEERRTDYWISADNCVAEGDKMMIKSYHEERLAIE